MKSMSPLLSISYILNALKNDNSEGHIQDYCLMGHHDSFSSGLPLLVTLMANMNSLPAAKLDNEEHADWT